jgi:predicted outer membrane repeat protein
MKEKSMSWVRNFTKGFRAHAIKVCVFMLAEITVLGASANVAAQDVVVGNGTPASCTQDALREALLIASGQTVRFWCGNDPVSISLTTNEVDPVWGPVALAPLTSTTIDGGQRVTLRVEAGIILVRSEVSVMLRNITLLAAPTAREWAALVNEGTVTMDSVVWSEVAGYFDLVPVVINSGTLLAKKVSVTNLFATAALRNWGTATLTDSTFRSSWSIGNYGLITNRGVLRIRNSLFVDNRAEFQAAAIYNFGDLSVQGSQFSGNQAGFLGGAIFSSGEALVVKDSRFSSNGAGARGGAIYLEGGHGGTIDNCMFEGNYSVLGGAVSDAPFPNFGPGTGATANSPLTVKASVFRSNRANGYGGALFAPNARIIHSIFAENTADFLHGGRGGAIYGGTLTIRGSTITNNTAATGYPESPAPEGGGVFVDLSWFGGSLPVLSQAVISGNIPNDVTVEP